ncbi:EEF1A lysine methyltransferase 4 [Tachysurus ichikawai]
MEQRWQNGDSPADFVSYTLDEACCGNSALSLHLYLAGYTTITNVDYSNVCVENMAQRHSDCMGMSWVCMDARRLAFPDSSFDVVIEKGTLDAMLVEEQDPWNISDASTQLLHKVLKELSCVNDITSVTYSPVTRLQVDYKADRKVLCCLRSALVF